MNIIKKIGLDKLFYDPNSFDKDILDYIMYKIIEEVDIIDSFIKESKVDNSLNFFNVFIKCIF